MVPRFTARWIAAFLGRFCLVYGAVLLVAFTLPVSNLVHQGFIATASVVLRVVQGSEVARTFRLHEHGEIHVRVQAGEFRKSYDIAGVFVNNLGVFLALVAASPQLSWPQRLLSLAAGGSLIGVVNTLIMVGTVWRFEERYNELHHLTAPAAWRLVARVFADLSPTGGAYMLPIFLWGFLMVGPLPAPARRGAAPVGRVARNDPCPCGSGKKYKACCAR